MSQFDTLQTIALRVNELCNQFTSSKLSQEELAELEILSRKLYERAVILNYKAKEEGVYKKFSVQKEKEVITPKKTESELSKKEVKKTPVSDTGVIQFDFSDGFDLSKEEESKTDSIIEEERSEIEAENVTVVFNNQINHGEDINKEKIEVQSEAEQDSPEKLFFYNRFSKAYKEADNDKLSNIKINSLKVAFGLNDRLQFTRELFNDDSTLFNDTIEMLDDLANNEVALRKLSEIAVENNWQKDAVIVDEFAHIINRRYV